MGMLVVVAGANALQAFASTGPPPFIGQGDPIRLSLNPKHWVWAREELEGPVSWRGSWTIPQPDPTSGGTAAGTTPDADPAHGPLANLPVLQISGWERISAALDGRLTDLAFDSAAGGSSFEFIETWSGFFEVQSTAMREADGTASLSSASILPLKPPGASVARPVTLPSGRERLATRPRPTGSANATNTIGVVDVAAFAARAGCGANATMRSGFAARSSATIPGK
jgi:hypothetical protein